jgi:hypothetical protein
MAPNIELPSATTLSEASTKTSHRGHDQPGNTAAAPTAVKAEEENCIVKEVNTTSENHR